ncbi:hypothetical protein [Acaryochloris marina]|uniref:hypothetical protein n=1 Tax=Acaryochloris marina TaxID=155978 RepID=UPI0021C3DD8D|nr:hypothetical protein [Acaryochloris marina]BDM83317.1 hypothetical protein AM10699_61780 [Acaryochloris marina MBIC10699]
MKRIHIAITTHDLVSTVQDYSARLGIQPCINVQLGYALRRTEIFNFSVRHDLTCDPEELRHMSCEDETAEASTSKTDCNGILWERFTAHHQGTEINQIWPHAQYVPDKV